ncbi:MAG: hypothetical protein Q9159_000494 [Coniocarpon cinnabarinum]
MATRPQVVVPTPKIADVKSTRSQVDGNEEATFDTRSSTPDEDAEGDRDEDFYQDHQVSPQEDAAREDTPKSGTKRKRNSHQSYKKNARLRATLSDENDEDENEEEASDDASVSSSEAEAEWELESDSAADEELENADGSQCVFCNQDENDDPGEEFEEPFTCTTCGQKEGDIWNCPSCVQNGVERRSTSLAPSSILRQSPAPKFARDLLPAQRGSAKPGSHSVFNTLILSDDPMDGSRSLRKRKTSSESQEKPTFEVRKKPRRATSEVEKPAPTSYLDGQVDTNNLLPNSGNVDSPRTRGSRRNAHAHNKPERRLTSITDAHKGDKLTIVIRLPPEKLGALDHEKRKRKKREYERLRRERMHRPAVPEPEVNHFPGLPPHTLREQYLLSETGTDDKPKPKLYGGILSEAEADTSRSFPQPADMRKFEDARKKAEEHWKHKVQKAAATDLIRGGQKQANSASKIKCINFAGYEIDTWHAAPYPEEYTRNRVLYICEYCLKYMNSDFVAWRHKLKCPAKHPPGDEIYRDGSFSFFEIDGRKNPVYCQNLCLLAKLFLGSKTLYYDVDPFLFYIMTENDDFGCHFVGYFSKEKRPSSQNNVSCILVLPIHQRRGFGNFLIDFSYLLSRVEGKTGSPEKPLSDLGLVTYRSYWRLVMCYQLVNQRASLSVNELSERTGMTADDVVCALEGLRALVRDPVTKTYALRVDHDYMRQYIADYKAKGYVQLNESALLWVPYVMGRDNQHYETAAPLRTVAQRDEENDAEPEEGVQQAAAEASREMAMSNADTGSKQASTPGEQDLATPFPSLSNAESTQATAHGSTTTTPKIMPSTPFVQLAGADEELEAIPATRFEIFPPLPGTNSRRRQHGRALKHQPSFRSSSTRAHHPNENTATSAAGVPRASTLRRGRSKLGEVVFGEPASVDRNEDQDSRDDVPSPSQGRNKKGADELLSGDHEADDEDPDDQDELAAQQ